MAGPERRRLRESGPIEMWLITSAAFVGQELAAEFGLIPPCFLPVGSRHLLEYQVEEIGTEAEIYVTLPEGYVLSDFDVGAISRLGVRIIEVPVDLSLGDSIVFALNLIGAGDRALRILHGDTLIRGFAQQEVDVIGVVSGGDEYSWAEVELRGASVVSLETVQPGVGASTGRQIACGYFAFSSSLELVRCVTRSRGNFISAINQYLSLMPMNATIIESWNDFGHVQTYFRSRRIVTSARHFNYVEIGDRTALKSSSDVEKICAEAKWFEQVPSGIRVFTARLIDADVNGTDIAAYETEYAYNPTLAELFVHGRLGAKVWDAILNSCRDFLGQCVLFRDDAEAGPLLRVLALSKTLDRLGQFATESGFDIHAVCRYDRVSLPSLMQIAEDLASNVDFEARRSAHVMHGDFCFSNIIYDGRTRRIRVIDPRGFVHRGEPSIFGDVRYDLAKLAHSIFGRYDQIIAGRYRIDGVGSKSAKIVFEQLPHHLWLERAARTFSVDGYLVGSREIRALTVLLFLSMLPLHRDRPDRQRAFVVNALRLYADLEVPR